MGELRDGVITEYEIHPEDFDLAMMSNRSIRVGSPEESRAMLLEALSGQPGTPCEIVVFNAGAALYAADRVASIGEGIALARETIRSGAARAKLDEWIRFTSGLAG